jgi:hypothetical protein
MRTPQYIIKIAADDVTRLRKIDVFRVLENCRGEEVQKTAHFIRVNRPELSDEVVSCLQDIQAQEVVLRPVIATRNVRSEL